MLPRNSMIAVLGLAMLVSSARAAGPQTIMAPAATAPAVVLAPSTSPSVGSAGDLRAALARKARDNRTDVQAQLEQQLYHFLAGEPALAANELASLPPEDRDIVTAVIEGLIKFRMENQREPSAPLAKKIEPMLQMGQRLRERANLTVSNLTLCDSVERFGFYEPVANGAFPAGKEVPAVLYCEIDNFHPEKTATGVWETKLSYQLALYTETEPAVSVYTKPSTAVLDRCPSRRRDFFIADKIVIPGKLPAGKYILKVSITDEQAKRVGEATTPVRIVAGSE